MELSKNARWCVSAHLNFLLFKHRALDLRGHLWPCSTAKVSVFGDQLLVLAQVQLIPGLG